MLLLPDNRQEGQTLICRGFDAAPSAPSAIDVFFVLLLLAFLVTSRTFWYSVFFSSIFFYTDNNFRFFSPLFLKSMGASERVMIIPCRGTLSGNKKNIIFVKKGAFFLHGLRVVVARTLLEPSCGDRFLFSRVKTSVREQRRKNAWRDFFLQNNTMLSYSVLFLEG
jgi:hypothetical protein